MLIQRNAVKAEVLKGLKRSPSVALLGARQCGKTTLAREILKEKGGTFFDLESPADQLRLQNPEQTLESLEGLVILDEIQAKPDLFPVLRALLDKKRASFLLLGSASPTIYRTAGESLAGRVEFVDLHGFGLHEVGETNLQPLWARGGFPRSYLATSDEDSAAWREGFIRTFLQRDLPQFGIQVPEPTMRRFWTMLAHAHGQVLNSSNLARSMGMTDKTIRSYIDHLEQTYMVRVLPAWHENLKKRQVKAPKVYLRDSGLLHTLQSISSYDQLSGNPVIGASWEGVVIEQLIRMHRLSQVYFWASHASAELDLFVLHGGRRLGFEVKLSESPRIERSMRVALSDLNLDRLTILYPGDQIIDVEPSIRFLGVSRLQEALS
jgi:predicted AAA+ superfamily ATPase